MRIAELLDESYLESKTIEYKGIIEEGKNKDGKNLEIGWLKTLVAFANTEGGKLIIGVEDKTHTVVALNQKEADRVILILHRQIREHIEPVIDYDISTVLINDTVTPRFVIIVEVKASKNLPVTLHDNGLLGIYVRNFGRTDLATQEQIRDLVLMSDNTPYDVTFEDDAYNPKDFSVLQSVAISRGVEINEKLLMSKHIISDDRRLSRGAMLFKDSCLDSRTKIVMTVWPGLTKGSDIINATEEYTGNLLDGINAAISFVKNHSVNGYKKEADTRTEYFSYPARSVTEGIVNAVGHRNYYIQGSQIEINIFKDRLEITSPGSLLGVRELHEEKNISSIIPRRRNDVICSVLEICKYMDEERAGFDKIEADYASYGELYQPFVSADASSFTLTLPDLTRGNGIASKEDDSPEIYTTVTLRGKRYLEILSFCYNSPRSVSEIAEHLNIVPSTYLRQVTIKKLVDDGMLIETAFGEPKKYSSNKKLVFLK